MSVRRMRGGFALLMALVLVLLAGTLLTAVARRSIVGAVETQEALEELQRRWAITSCQATLLGDVENLLQEAERGEITPGQPAEGYKNKPIKELRVACQLAGRDYELVLTDEQAKLNVNALLKGLGAARTQTAVTRLVAESGVERRAVAIRPLPAGRKGAKELPRLLPVGGYGQIFDGAGPDGLAGAEQIRGLAASVTCWGDGRVNIRRASAKVIEEACVDALGRDIVAALLAARERDPYRKLPAMMGELAALEPTRRAKVGQYVTDRSECHGLWVIARGTQRSWYHLVIGVGGSPTTEPAGDTGGQNISQRYCFSW